IQPSEAGAVNRHPRVRGTRTDAAVIGAKITADIARGQAERAQAGDHDVREILTDTLARMKRFRHLGGDGSSVAVVLEILENSMTEIERALKHGPLRRKRGPRVMGKFRGRRHAW